VLIQPLLVGLTGLGGWTATPTSRLGLAVPGVSVGAVAARCVDGGLRLCSAAGFDVHHLMLLGDEHSRTLHGPHYSPASWASTWSWLHEPNSGLGRLASPNSTLQNGSTTRHDLPAWQPTLSQHSGI